MRINNFYNIFEPQQLFFDGLEMYNAI